jgi:hypothetical protein
MALVVVKGVVVSGAGHSARSGQNFLWCS